jgi:hypothetical protein
MSRSLETEVILLSEEVDEIKKKIDEKPWLLPSYYARLAVIHDRSQAIISEEARNQIGLRIVK